ncbi:MAG: hypothetical protein CL429_00825 [Acidimicrobiaceae bacterium]|nr:hypothetical protein [Acidimicrobiaceae bacterium]
MDYRLINSLESQPGWKALNKFIYMRIQELERDILNTYNLHNEASRMHISKTQGEREALKGLIDLVADPKRIAHYFESDLQNW